MGGIILIIVGIVLGSWAVKHGALQIESQKAVIFQGPLGGVFQLVCMFGGLGLQIYGVILLLS